jgi:NodT family efflux transporter outer membrane factor (OMF) lipoprotein
MKYDIHPGTYGWWNRLQPVILLAVAALLLTSCAVGPNYKRPQVITPDQLRGAGQAAPAAGEKPIAELSASDLFHDPTLTGLLKTALAQNFDLRIGTERVLEARSQYGITRSGIFPTLDATGQYAATRTSSVGSYTFVPAGLNLSSSYTQTGFALSWELDVWGRLRRLTESARAQYLATEEARNGVVSTIIADVSSNYLSLLELDMELEIARNTRDAAERGQQLIDLRHQRGAATGLDVRQAQELLYTATAQIAATERQIGQTENAISLLLGQNPTSVPRGAKLSELPQITTIPVGLPSAILERRPDVREAEQALVAANAQIGAAKALWFPQISLTGFLGGQSRSLSSLFSGPGRQWSIAPAADLSIFNAGRIRSNVHFTEATQREMVATYQKAIQNAFREVSDALIEHDRTAEQRKQQELFVQALEDADRLSLLRYQGGLDSYLQVLDAERNLFQGQLTLARLRRDELLAVVQLYRALGGGWQ